MTLVYRSVKGSKLTSAEADGNIHDLDDRVTALEDNPNEGVGIVDAVQSGDSFYFTKTDSTQTGLINLPSLQSLADNFVGPWVAETLFARDKIFTAAGALYLVLQNHITESTFDAGAGDSDGDYYGLLLAAPDISTIAPPVVTVDTATYTLTAATAGRYHRFTNAAGCTITVPTDATEPTILVASEFHLRQCADGQLLVIAENEDSDPLPIINPEREGFDNNTQWKGATLTLKKVGADEWDVIGAPGDDLASSDSA